MTDKKQPKPWWESKTIWLNLAAGVLAVADTATEALRPVLPPEAMGGILAAVAVANVVLRAITGQPVVAKRAAPVSAETTSSGV